MGPSCVYMTGSQGYIYEAGNMLGEVGGASSVVGGAGSVDEPEDVRAVLWYKVARNSTDVQEQAKAYQEAITLLKSSVHSSVKIEYLIEFGGWLHNHGYPPEQATEQLMHAIKLLCCSISSTQATPPSRPSTQASRPSIKTDVAPSGTDVATGDDVSKLECCMRAYVMMAQIEGRTSKEGLGTTLLSLGCCMRMWKSTFGCLGNSGNGNVQGQPSVPIWPTTPEVKVCSYRIAVLCFMLGLKQAASYHNERAGQTTSAEDMARVRAEVLLCGAQRKAVTREGTKPGFIHHLELEQDLLAMEHCPDAIPTREVWLQQAQLLVEQGQYQPARELLDEAFQSCQVYEDRLVLGRVLLAQASLATIEKNYPLAAELLQKLQKLPLPAMVWLEAVLLQCEVLSHTHLQHMDSIVEHSLSVLAGRLHNNERHFLEYARVKLRAKHAVVSISQLESSRLLDQCQVVSVCADHLAQLGHHYEATQLWTIEANTLKSVGLAMKGQGHYKQLLLKALDSCHKSRCTLQTLLDVAQELCKLSQAVSLPVQHKLVISMLDEAHLLAAIFEDHAHTQRDLWNKRRQKSSAEKLIEDYVKGTADHSTEDQVWSGTSRCAMEQALSLLVSAHSLAFDEDMRSQISYASGHLLLLLSEHTSPHGPLQWREDVGKRGEEVERQLSALSVVMRKEEAQREEACEAESLQFLAQATQSLAQALRLALQCGNLEIAKKAAFRLMECFGCHDAASSAQYLALYQSCAVSLEFHKLLPLLHPSIYHTELGALLLQNTHLSTHTSPPSCTPTAEANSQKLQQYECWKRLAVCSGHLDLLRSFPPHFRCVVLQHSPDKTQLYAAYLIPPQPPPPAPKKGQTPIPADVIEPVLCRVSVDPKAFHSLLDLMADFKKELSATLLKEQYSNVQNGNPGQQDGNPRQQDGNPRQADQENQSACADIIAATEEYLSEAIRPISKVLQREGGDKKLVLVLLADTTLMQLPLEALGFLHSTTITAVCRDFSLQMLHYRMAKFQNESGTVEETTTKDKKKVEKYAAPPSAVLADPANFKYILDPRNEAQSHGFSPVHEIIETFQSFPKLTSKWSGLKGSEHAISSGEWPALLRGCSGLIFFGYERFLAHFPAAKLTSLNLSNCSVVLLMDQMQTNASILYQSREDLGKSDSELQMEQHLHAMLCLSLTGVGCTVASQWSCTVHNNLIFTKALVKGLLSESRTLGELVWETRHHRETAKPSAPEQLSDQNPPPAPPTPAEDIVVKYATVVYGLPHIVLVPPSI
eukprot:Em0013g30a